MIQIIAMHDLFTPKGASVVGMASTDGYDRSESEAEVDRKFVRLMYDKSKEKATAWVAQLKGECSSKFVLPGRIKVVQEAYAGWR